MAFYAVILFTFFALLLPWAVLMLGGNNPFLWLWNYLDNVHIRVRKYRMKITTILLVLEIRCYDLQSTGRGFLYEKLGDGPSSRLGLYIRDPGLIYGVDDESTSIVRCQSIS